MIDALGIVAIVGSIGGVAITVGTLMKWYDSRVESRVVILRRLNHLENNLDNHTKNVKFLHDEQDEELKSLQLKVDGLGHKNTNLYWMIKTILAKLEISASSLGFSEED